MDKDIVRMTIVYADGSMTILSKNKDGTLNVDRRTKWWSVLSVKKKPMPIILGDMVCA